MEDKAIERVWQALTAVDYWLHNDFTTMLNQSANVNPSEWTIVHEAAKILNLEQLSLPPEIYRLGMDALKESLQPNANKLLDLMRALLQVRADGDTAVEAETLEAINTQIRFMVDDFRSRLLILKAVIDEEEAVFILADGIERISLTTLHQLLSSRFSEDELRTFCLVLNVDYEDLPATGKVNKARELVTYMARRGNLDRLLEAGMDTRSDVPWQEALISD